MKKFLLFLLVLIVTFMGFGYYQYNKVIEKVLFYSQDSAKEISKIKITEDTMLETRKKLADTWKNFENGTQDIDLILTGEEVNVFVKDIDENIKLTKYIYLKASDSKIISEFSIPLEKAPFLSNKKFKSKYLNGEGSFEVKYNKDNPSVMKVKINNIKIGDKDINEVSKDFNDLDLTSAFKKDKNLEAAFNNIDSIYLEDDKLIIKPKVKESANPSENNDTANGSENEKNGEESLNEVLKDI